MKITTHSDSETRRLAGEYAKTLKKGDIIFLNGEMGAGKTVFVQGCLKALGYDGPVTSPTFALCNEYFADLHVLHCDLYRISDPDEVYSAGIYDSDADVIFVEWAERADDALKNSRQIDFEYGKNENERILTFGLGDSFNENTCS